MLTRKIGIESRWVWSGGWGGGERAWEYAYVCAELKKIMFQFVMWIISKLSVSVGGLLFFKAFSVLAVLFMHYTIFIFSMYHLFNLCTPMSDLRTSCERLAHKCSQTNKQARKTLQTAQCQWRHDIDFLYFSFLVLFVVVFIFQENTRPEWLLTNHSEISSPLFR